MTSKLKIIDWHKTSTKVLLVVFVALMILSTYFIYSSYKIYLNNAEEATLEKLKGISNTMTLNIDYRDQEYLNNRLMSVQKKDIEQDSIYQKLHNYLKECQKINNLKTEISVLYLDRPTQKFYYICASNDTSCYFGDKYVLTTKVFTDNYDKGAVIGKYTDEYGIWLTSFSPILNNFNESVGIIEVDILFDNFITKAKVQLYRNLLISLAICIITAFFLLNYVKIIVVGEEASKMKLKKSYEIITEKNNDIVQSINYAKRIQSAILPSNELLQELLKDYFILYKPKDIVAGDFYWIEKKDDIIFFASADCTGHGVPGAMVSVVCHNALNRSVREYGLVEPGEILDKTREIVIHEFYNSIDNVKDGMDIALCSIKGDDLKYAGANNPLWRIRDGVLIETKADKQPIGIFDNQKKYVTHDFKILKGDSIYVFSDGYVDQFGGEQGKKYKTKAFRELLLSIQDKSMGEQRAIIDKVFEDWKGDLEQIDDVCVIGVKV